MERDRRGHRFAGGSSAACPASRRASRRHRTDRGIGGYSALWCAGVSRLDSVALAPAPTVRDVARSGHRAADLCRHVRAVNVRHWPCDEYGGRRKAGVGADGGPRRTPLLTPVQSFCERRPTSLLKRFATTLSRASCVCRPPMSVSYTHL